MKIFSYWRSTTSYRVRAALNLKGLAYYTVPMAPDPMLSRIKTACLAHPAIYAARSENQPDALREMKAPV